MEKGLRFERKYYVNEAKAAILRNRIRILLTPDKHSGGVYTVHNIYLDDIHNSAYAQKVSGVIRRKKYRVRHYNGDLGFVRLECKQKEGIHVRKLTAPISEEQWHLLAMGRLPMVSDCEHPIWREVALAGATHRLQPVLDLAYEREAYTYRPGNVRVTFDSGLRAGPVGGHTKHASFLPGQSVVELKYDHFLPDAVAMLFSGLELRESAISKYVLARETIWKVWRYDKA